jgi:hypothetical protein
LAKQNVKICVRAIGQRLSVFWGFLVAKFLKENIFSNYVEVGSKHIEGSMLMCFLLSCL